MASKRRTTFYENKKQEATEIGIVGSANGAEDEPPLRDRQTMSRLPAAIMQMMDRSSWHHMMSTTRSQQMLDLSKLRVGNRPPGPSGRIVPSLRDVPTLKPPRPPCRLECQCTRVKVERKTVITRCLPLFAAPILFCLEVNTPRVKEMSIRR
ncbi:hypothetical protein AAG570_012099 [Ranatra chinensis]|uniref:Uncharacterized protein n=1 Tax=Ranatra chinensis TaxID=642074 RepID=A0ABD0Z040_9HEMI